MKISKLSDDHVLLRLGGNKLAITGYGIFLWEPKTDFIHLNISYDDGNSIDHLDQTKSKYQILIDELREPI